MTRREAELLEAIRRKDKEIEEGGRELTPVIETTSPQPPQQTSQTEQSRQQSDQSQAQSQQQRVQLQLNLPAPQASNTNVIPPQAANIRIEKTFGNKNRRNIYSYNEELPKKS